MAKSKLSEIELRIKNHTPPEINFSFQRTVSYSQYSTYANCPHQWYLTYVEGKQPYQASIHTVFGTAFHETLQKYIDTMYNESGAAADRMNLEETSTRGWSEREKKDDTKLAQILLYKEYFGRQFGFDVDRIEVEYFIVKRKIWENSEYAIPRVQSFKPASGKAKRRQAVEKMESFIKDCFDESGKPQIKSYIKNIGESSCKWCPYADKPELCDKK